MQQNGTRSPPNDCMFNCINGNDGCGNMEDYFEVMTDSATRVCCDLLQLHVC